MITRRTRVLSCFFANKFPLIVILLAEQYSELLANTDSGHLSYQPARRFELREVESTSVRRLNLLLLSAWECFGLFSYFVTLRAVVKKGRLLSTISFY